MSVQTWTYSGNPSASSLDEVRYLIGDTDPTDRQLGDEEILYCVAQSPSIFSAASMACTSLVAKYARSVMKHVGDLRIEAQSKQEHYRALSDSYAIQAGEAGLSPYALMPPFAGGISRADRANTIMDTDRVEPSFEVASMDRPGTNRGQWRGGSTAWR